MGDILFGTPHFPASGQNVTAIQLRPTLSRSLTPKLAANWLERLRGNPRCLINVVLGRQFTHERLMAGSAIAAFEAGLEPIVKAGRLGALVMQFPDDFRFCRENRDHLIALRRAFHRYPLVADASHPSWETSEAEGVRIDYRLGTVSRDVVLTSAIGYCRFGAEDDLKRIARRAQRSAALADRVFLIGDTVELVEEVRALLGVETVRPLQPAFEFTRAVA